MSKSSHPQLGVSTFVTVTSKFAVTGFEIRFARLWTLAESPSGPDRGKLLQLRRLTFFTLFDSNFGRLLSLHVDHVVSVLWMLSAHLFRWSDISAAHFS